MGTGLSDDSCACSGIQSVENHMHVNQFDENVFYPACTFSSGTPNCGRMCTQWQCPHSNGNAGRVVCRKSCTEVETVTVFSTVVGRIHVLDCVRRSVMDLSRVSACG